MIKTVMFDLDGTLLAADQEIFTRAYFKELAKRFAPLGYDPDDLVKGVWKGVAAMVRNDGRRSNYDVFWDCFFDCFGEESRKHVDDFNDFYVNEFNRAKEVCGFNPLVPEIVNALKENGISLILASNPVFPMTAQKARMRWAGVDPDDFVYLTSYENSSYCKPNSDYYREILEKTGCKAEECLMVGNDVDEDTPAAEVGMKVFIVTDFLINKYNENFSSFPHGDFNALKDYLSNILGII